MSLASLSGLSPLVAAIGRPQTLSTFINLLEMVLAAAPPEKVYAQLDSHGPIAKPTESIPASFGCISWHRFIFVLGGAYRLIREPRDREQDHLIKPNQFYWIRPGERNLIRNDTERSVFSVIFDDSYTRFIWYHHKKERSRGDAENAHTILHYHTHAAPSVELRHALTLMDFAVNGHPTMPTGHHTAIPTAHALLSWCLHELRLETERSTLTHLEPGRRSFEEIRAYIADHLHQNLDREQVAKTFSISEDHLTRTFRLYAKTGYIEYVRAQRLHLAERLLTTSRLSIKEVGAACGFNLSAYFIKRFREQYGETPARWKKAHAASMTP